MFLMKYSEYNVLVSIITYISSMLKCLTEIHASQTDILSQYHSIIVAEQFFAVHSGDFGIRIGSFKDANLVRKGTT